MEARDTKFTGEGAGFFQGSRADGRKLGIWGVPEPPGELPGDISSSENAPAKFVHLMAVK
jgi:hypothetical protein